ncbi:MAG: S8 family serine peptidase [Oscillospiraceae bacterium]|nr:S8 family serine peptidase [Oscillospiraceae bacterium]
MDYPDINDTYKIIGGDAFINAGYSGIGIRVGVIEEKRPILSGMGSDSNNITIVPNSAEITGEHPTMVCGIIKKFAPSCSIYTYALGNSPSYVVDACRDLINDYSVHVINLSIGSCYGMYTEFARRIDRIIRNTKVSIVVGAGNADTHERKLDDGEVEVEIDSLKTNILGMAGNAITVGNAKTNGTNPDASGAFTLSWNSCYDEYSAINKPDICAPGYIHIYDYGDYGTSYAAPHVTGTVVQMMARNPAFVDQPQKIKAALLASATRNCGTTFFEDRLMSDYEGAGVVDAEFCYRLSKAGRSTHFDATSNSDSFTHDVYCDYTTKPFRIACTWEAAAKGSGAVLYVTNYNLTVKKNGVTVAECKTNVSTGSNKYFNSKIIEIPTSVLRENGGGFYTVEISRDGEFKGTGTVRIGLAWEQD